MFHCILHLREEAEFKVGIRESSTFHHDPEIEILINGVSAVGIMTTPAIKLQNRRVLLAKLILANELNPATTLTIRMRLKWGFTNQSPSAESVKRSELIVHITRFHALLQRWRSKDVCCEQKTGILSSKMIHLKFLDFFFVWVAQFGRYQLQRCLELCLWCLKFFKNSTEMPVSRNHHLVTRDNPQIVIHYVLYASLCRRKRASPHVLKAS